jgi:Sec-independent protein translocase protein TatA
MTSLFKGIKEGLTGDKKDEPKQDKEDKPKDDKEDKDKDATKEEKKKPDAGSK